MKQIFTLLVISAFVFSCSELELGNEDLCTPVVCGEILNDKVNLAIYNDSGVDFDVLYYDIGGQSDSIDFFPLKQYTCWINVDTLKIEYYLAKGISENEVFESDTLWMQSNAEILTSGIYVLEIYQAEIDNKLVFQFVDNYSGECRDF